MLSNVNILTYLAEPGVLGVLVISVGKILRNIRKHVRFTNANFHLYISSYQILATLSRDIAKHFNYFDNVSCNSERNML